MPAKRKYIPAAGYEWLTPAYDPIQRWLMREPTIKGRLVDQADVQPGHRVLDLGCGTGTLAILLKQRHPGARVVGLDVDSRVLGLARTKAARAGVGIDWTLGMAHALPYGDDAFDRVVSSLVLHHLTNEDKRGALRETFRVLRNGGQLHVADFGQPHNAFTFLTSLLVRRFEEVAEHLAGALPAAVRAAGFEQVKMNAQYTTPFGTVALLEGQKAE